MGAYLSGPKTDKYSSDEVNEKLISGSSSMQGWRQTQEDAHNSILDFDDGASFFAVYDGHGGKEVAEYTAQHFPNFLKGLESYKKGFYEDALKEAFLKFDATLKEPEVVSILKELSKSGNNNAETTDSEDENLGNLKEEAQMPLAEVMAKYTANRECFVNSTVHSLKKDGKKVMPNSPYLRGKSSDAPNCSESTSSSSSNETERCSSCSDATNFQEADSEVSSSSSKYISQRKSLSEKYKNGLSETSGKSETSNEEQVNGLSEGDDPVSDSVSDSVNVISKKNEDASAELPDSSADLDKTDNSFVNGKETQTNNTEAKPDDAITSSVGNGEVSEAPKGKGKGKALVKGQAHKDKKEPMSAEQIFEGFVKLDQSEDYSESDSDDATFHGPDSTSDDDEAEVDGDEEDDEEDEEEDEDDSEEYDEDDDDDDEFTMNMTDEPGFDSGCTAVVALVVNNKIYVANAGDSRCIVSKKGEVIEMSLDHKPEDVLEMERIKKAGGRVTCDGRVNGGLNLSRALGDHSYKRVEELPAEEQMISPLPDIKVLDLDGDVEFMILACDGIWNFMSSQEVQEFVRTRLLKSPVKISQICEELFDFCLAPNTLGDGTGCDNMTAVLVQFKHSILSSAKKRQEDELEREDCKRQKTDDAVSGNSLDSSKCDSTLSKADAEVPDTTE